MPEPFQQPRDHVNKPGMLFGVTVVELSDETAEYSGLLLAGMGAKVLKIEPPGGCSSRRLPPFQNDVEDPEKSLFFWAYNRGKRSIVLDLEGEEGRCALLRILSEADVLLEATAGKFEKILGMNRQALLTKYPGLIVARMTPFGDEGPWKDFRASDLIHMALGGVMSNCGYDPDLNGNYDVPPISPQFWQSYHIAGEQLVVGELP